MRTVDPGRTCSIATARRMLAQRFGAAGIETPELDARVLVGHALGLEPAALAAAPDQALNAPQCARIAGLAARRLAHEPVARIVGVREFWGLQICVTPAVLVPRPETETVVETALAAIDAEGARSRPVRIADLGTGSGALLIALLSELPGARGIGTDRSAPALQVARANVKRLGLASRAAFVAGDFGAALRGDFDLIVANPPYVASADVRQLAPEVRDHDPTLALDGGVDGLCGYRALAADAPRLLACGGHVVVELGAGQAQAVAALFAEAGLVAAASAVPDLAGTARALRVRHAIRG